MLLQIYHWKRQQECSHLFKKYCREGGTLTTSKNLRENYIPCVADELRTKIEGIINEIKSEHAVFSINILTLMKQLMKKKDMFLIRF